LAYLLTGDPSAAEDLTQEAFVRIAGRIQRGWNPSSFDAYLRQAVVNLHRSKLRRLRLERSWLARERGERAASVAEPEFHDELWRALRSLPARQRAAVVLRFYEDLSEREVASLLSCSPGAVGQLVVRAMAAMREQLGGDEP
jgi:RNA polymerase sigma-70 factor (sigma-E family)